MQKRKYLVFLLCITLCYSVLPHSAGAKSSLQISLPLTGSIVNPLPNLALIPVDWGDYLMYGDVDYGAGPQITRVDNSVLHNGDVSIRIDPHTSSDVNTARELDSNMISVKPGDHIVFTCWIKTTASQTAAYNNDPTDSYGKGARIGIDFYTASGMAGIGALVDGVGSGSITISGNYGSAGSHIPWNTPTWTLQTINCIVPNGYSITSIIPWMQAESATDSGLGWFADAGLYVNP
jgi:hypothetical protein